MSIFSLSLTEIFSNLLSLGVNITEEQATLLKWRFSSDANKYYSDKENTDFYEALTHGNTDVIDAIRKEKQKRIDDMKQDLLKMIFIFVIPIFLTSCSYLNPMRNIDTKVLEQKWDSNSLTEKDKTYTFSDQPVKLDGDFTSTKFKGDWVIVNQDFIKVHNENQDTLIRSLEKIKELKDQLDKKNKTLLYALSGFIVFVIMCAVVAIFRQVTKGEKS